MRKSLEYLAAGVLALASIAGGCKPLFNEYKDNRPNPVTIKVPYENIPRIPLEEQLVQLASTPEFDVSEAAFMATGLNQWELGEVKKAFDSKIKKVKQSSRFQQAKTIPEKTRVIFEELYDFRKYNEETSSVVSTMGRTGNCMGGTVYLRMACQKFGIDLVSVLTERHIFSRLKDKEKTRDIENTEEFGFDYKRKKPLPWQKEITNDRELIAEYLCNLSAYAEEKEKDVKLAFRIASAKVHPDAFNIYRVSYGVRWNYGSDNEIRILREINSLHPDSDIAKEVLARGLSFREAPGDVQEAIDLMLPVVERKSPLNELRYEFMGLLYSKLGENSIAAKYFQKAVEMNPANKLSTERLKRIKD